MKQLVLIMSVVLSGCMLSSEDSVHSITPVSCANSEAPRDSGYIMGKFVSYETCGQYVVININDDGIVYQISMSPNSFLRIYHILKKNINSDLVLIRQSHGKKLMAKWVDYSLDPSNLYCDETWAYDINFEYLNDSKENACARI